MYNFLPAPNCRYSERKPIFAGMTAEVSVVIVSYNVVGLLRKCLQSVFSQHSKVEVVVVDNCSTDNSLEMVRSEFPQLKLIANSNNVGFSEANNQGIKATSAEYIFLLNPDTELRTDALQSLLKCAKSVGGDCIVGPRLLNTDGSLQISAWKKSTPWSMIAEAFFLRSALMVAEYDRNVFNEKFNPGMISGAAMLFPRTLANDIGGLDPKLFWMEDADFCYRATKINATILYDPSAVVVHHSGQSAKKNLGVVISNQLLSKLKYYRKHYGLFVMLLTAPFCLFHIVSRLLIFAILAPVSKGNAVKAKAYWFSVGRFFSYVFSGDERIA